MNMVVLSMPDYVALICAVLIIISTFFLYGYSNSRKKGMVLFSYLIIFPVIVYDYYIFITRYLFSGLIKGLVHLAIYLFLLLVNHFVLKKVKYKFRPLYIMLFYLSAPLAAVIIYKLYEFMSLYFAS